MRRSNKNRIARDPIHIYASRRFYIVHMNVPVLRDQINDVVLRRHLHGDREIVLRLRREEYVHRLLGERLIPRRTLADLDYVQLAALHGSDGETEERRRFRVALHFERGEGGGVALYRLRAFALHGIQLHGADDARLLGAYADQQEPVLFRVRSVVDYLAAVQRRMSELIKIFLLPSDLCKYNP